MKLTARLLKRACCFMIVMAMMLSLSSSLIVTAMNTITEQDTDTVTIPDKK